VSQPVGGTVVGPGAAPSVAPTAAPSSGTGIPTGTYKYAYSHVTPSGESLPSPLATATTGPIAAPTVNPTLNPVQVGAGADPGSHYWGLSFVSGSGETTALISTNSRDTYDLSAPTGPSSVTSATYQQPAPWSGQTVYLNYVGVTASGIETALSGSGQIETIAADRLLHGLTSPAPAPANVSGYRLYCSRNAGSTFHRCDTVQFTNGLITPGAAVVGPFLPNTLAEFDAAPTATYAPVSVRTVPLTAIQIGPPGTTARRIYRTPTNAAYAYGNFRLATTINDNTTTTWTDTVADAALGAAPPASNTTQLNQVTLTGVALGSGATNARKVYRTVVGGAQLKLLPTGTTFANNTTTGPFVDTNADASLGANAPTSDTSGLTQPPGQVLPGATSIPTAGTAPFTSGGGWAITSQQMIRYSGLSGNALTGVPASGAGAIVTTILYGAAITPVPALIGVTGLTKAMARGAAVHLFVQRDNTDAQAALGALERNPDGSGTDGIREFLVSDERRTEPSLAALCDADLASFAHPVVSVTYATFDPKTRAGTSIGINFATGIFNPSIFNAAIFHTGVAGFGYAGTYLINDVTITIDPGPVPGRPRYLVHATSQRFTFTDLLRRVLIGA